MRFRYASLNAARERAYSLPVAFGITAEDASAENLHRGVRDNYLYRTKFASSSSLRACAFLFPSFCLCTHVTSRVILIIIIISTHVSILSFIPPGDRSRCFEARSIRSLARSFEPMIGKNRANFNRDFAD